MFHTKKNVPQCVPHHGKLLHGVSHTVEIALWCVPHHGQLLCGVFHTMENCSAVCPTTRKKVFCWISPPKRKMNHSKVSLSRSKGRVWCKKLRPNISWHCPFKQPWQNTCLFAHKLYSLICTYLSVNTTLSANLISWDCPLSRTWIEFLIRMMWSSSRQW